MLILRRAFVVAYILTLAEVQNFSYEYSEKSDQSDDELVYNRSPKSYPKARTSRRYSERTMLIVRVSYALR